MARLLTGVILGLWVSHASACLFPENLKFSKMTYRVESLASSLQVELQLPDLGTLACDEFTVAFGKMWRWELSAGQPIRVEVRDRNGVIVQVVNLEGELTLKDNPPYASVAFSSLKAVPSLKDHTWVRADLKGGGTFLTTPSIEVDERGTRVRYAVTLTP